MENQIGIFICTGCEIGKCINTGQLKELAEKENAVFITEHPALCSENGVSTYFSAIEKSDLHGVLVAACSPRFKPELFEHDTVLTKRINLREQVAWVMEPGSEDMQMAAEDYLKMGIAKLKSSKTPVPYMDEQVSSDILIVGAGITGISAAIDGASAGYNIHLIEKEAHPGGYASKLKGQIPYKEPFDKIAEPIVYEKIVDLGLEQKIQLYTSTTIKRISGQPGNFEVELQGATLSV